MYRVVNGLRSGFKAEQLAGLRKVLGPKAFGIFEKKLLKAKTADDLAAVVRATYQLEPFCYTFGKFILFL